MEAMIRVFIAEMPLAAANMRAAFQAGDFTCVATIVHRIKPAIDNMQVFMLIDVIKELDTLSKNPTDTKKMDSLIAVVENVIGTVSRHLQGFVNPVTNS